jgi:hypothetical protein
MIKKLWSVQCDSVVVLSAVAACLFLVGARFELDSMHLLAFLPDLLDCLNRE